MAICGITIAVYSGLGGRIESRDLVDLRREVLVGEAEGEVLDQRAAACSNASVKYSGLPEK